MPKFEVEEALETDRWLSEGEIVFEAVGEEIELLHCLECDGTNLNEEGTICWDCSASDYR